MEHSRRIQLKDLLQHPFFTKRKLTEADPTGKRLDTRLSYIL